MPMNSAEASQALEGWQAFAAGLRYDLSAPLAWRCGWRWRQDSGFRAANGRAHERVSI